MSNFKTGVYELHAINPQGANQYFAVSGELMSQEQLNAWFAAETAKHHLPTGFNWYPLNDTDNRFGKQQPVTQAPTDTPPTAPMPGQGSGVPGQGESAAGTGPPVKAPGHNANTLDGTDVVLAHDGSKGGKPVELEPVPTDLVLDDDEVRAKQKEIWAKRNASNIELGQKLKQHMANFKLG